MREINYAENDKRIQDNPTDADCVRLGATHAAYGWSRSPWGHWTDRQKELYRQGYETKDG